MSISWGGEGQSNSVLSASPADVVAPGQQKTEDYDLDPPIATGAKIIIADFDHINWRTRDPHAVWRHFLRGNNPVFFDAGVNKFDWATGKTVAEDSSWDAIRRAGGDTRRYAERMNLAAMVPRNELSSTRYCLANPGSEYLIYQPT